MHREEGIREIIVELLQIGSAPLLLIIFMASRLINFQPSVDSLVSTIVFLIFALNAPAYLWGIVSFMVNLLRPNPLFHRQISQIRVHLVIGGILFSLFGIVLVLAVHISVAFTILTQLIIWFILMMAVTTITTGAVRFIFCNYSGRFRSK